MTDIVNMNVDVPKPKRARRKRFTEQEQIEKDIQKCRKYYYSHLEDARVRQKKYMDGYKLYMNLLELINTNVLPENVVNVLEQNNIIDHNYLNSVNSLKKPSIKDKPIINGSALGNSKPNACDNITSQITEQSKV